MKRKRFYYGFADKIKSLYTNLTLSIKSLFKKIFFSSETTKDGDHNVEEQEIWFDAFEKQEIIQNTQVIEDKEEVWFDALDNTESEDFEYVNAEESNDKIVIEDEGCLGLQSASEERGKVDNKTLALAFQIEKDKSIVNSVNFSSLKLKNMYHVGNETFLKFVDYSNNCCMLCAESLNVYLPEYFKKHSGRFCDEIFPKSQNGISNNVVIVLEVPKEVDFITESPSSFTGNFIKSMVNKFTKIKMPESQCVNISYLDGMVNFNFDSEESNNIFLKIEDNLHNRSKIINKLVPSETIWPVKDILIDENILNKKVATSCHVSSIEKYVETDKYIMVC